jgi:hypothetical protein
MDDDTIRVPLPPGVRLNPNLVITQEIPIVERTLELPPFHLLGDPILRMDAPRPDLTPLFDQIYGPPERLPRPVKRRMHTADKVLAGMGLAALASILFVYGMVTQGWGVGEIPDDPSALPGAYPTATTGYPVSILPEPLRSRQSPAQSRQTPIVVHTPHTHRPAPTRSVVVVTLPEPKPTPTPTAVPSPSPTPTPTPTETASPSESVSVPVLPRTKPSRSPR